ncbi:MAG: HAD-IIA family hydrolase [Lachnospiraceae bacterium]|nr:HAD-IIA family hydrolase [Lachnospiraceae bacterium]
MNPLADVKLYLLDMDGTFYLGEKLLPGALEFLDAVRKAGKDYLFLTNNSSRSLSDYVKRLRGFGAPVTEQDIFSSSDATLIYMEQKQMPKNILLFGTPSLERQFEEAGYEIRSSNPAAVVLGFDQTIDYKKLTLLCDAVRSGLPYIATHPDYNCPVEGGFIPDIGAIMAFVRASTGRDADVIIGKPNGFIAEAAAARKHLSCEQLCMVGDRLYTDIALGNHCNVKTALVYSGETSPAEYQSQNEVHATVTADNIGQLIAWL